MKEENNLIYKLEVIEGVEIDVLKELKTEYKNIRLK